MKELFYHERVDSHYFAIGCFKIEDQTLKNIISFHTIILPYMKLEQNTTMAAIMPLNTIRFFHFKVHYYTTFVYLSSCKFGVCPKDTLQSWYSTRGKAASKDRLYLQSYWFGIFNESISKLLTYLLFKK